MDALNDFKRIIFNKSQKIAYEHKCVINAGDEADANCVRVLNVEDESDILKLQTDGMDDYRIVTCLNDTSHDQLMEVLESKFKVALNSAEYEPLLSTMRNIKKTNYSNYFENSTSYPNTNGVASNFLVYWVVRYNERTDKYSACFGLSGVKITFSDIIVGYKQKIESSIVGYEPCKCFLFYCKECPIVGRMETNVPIFKKHVFSIKKQDVLKKYMLGKMLEYSNDISYERSLPHPSSPSEQPPSSPSEPPPLAA